MMQHAGLLNLGVEMAGFGQRGYSTLQWVLTFGFVAGLAGVGYFLALPAYYDSQVRRQVAEIFVSVDACRADVSKVVQTTTAAELSTSLFGCDGGASAGAKISPHLKSIAVNAAGAIRVTLDFRSLRELSPTTSTLTVVPMTNATTVLGSADVRKSISGWRCGSIGDGTTIPSKYLPATCRG